MRVAVHAANPPALARDAIAKHRVRPATPQHAAKLGVSGGAPEWASMIFSSAASPANGQRRAVNAMGQKPTSIARAAISAKCQCLVYCLGPC